MNLVIDIDGVLLDIHSEVEQYLQTVGNKGYTKDRILTYDLNKSLDLQSVPEWLSKTDNNRGSYYLNASRDEIFSALANPKLFQTAKWDIEALDIIKTICNLKGVNVHFWTLSFNQEIADIKRTKLQEYMKGSDYNLVSLVGSGKKALFNNRADVVIEDCAENLLSYPDSTIKFLISRSYNQEEFNKHLDFSRISRFETLSSALLYVLTLLGNSQKVRVSVN